MPEKLEFWEQFFKSFNGISFWMGDMKIETGVQVSSDTTDTIGFGVYF